MQCSPFEKSVKLLFGLQPRYLAEKHYAESNEEMQKCNLSYHLQLKLRDTGKKPRLDKLRRLVIILWLFCNTLLWSGAYI